MKKSILILIVFLALLTGCGWIVIEGGHPGPVPGGHGNLNIPPGHLPPPGECRIWYPDLPPGHQPPPGSCGALAGQVPPGAWLIQGQGKTVMVKEYHPQKPYVVISIGIYDFNTGKFLREMEP